MKYVLLISLILSAAIAAAQTPVLTSIAPVNIAQPDPGQLYVSTTVTLTGRGFKTGMVLVLDQPDSKTIVLAPKIVNQYKALVVFDSTTVKNAGFFPVHLVNRQGFSSGQLQVQICAPVAISTTTLPAMTPGVYYEAHLVAAGGCQ
jgi:hypothetical protein